ncbi:MAG: hypothetical protein HUK26_07510, partial [Duodenibacillus sp.]|nr:hypothetical protein [Duodenibacillus sp.]
MQQTLEPKGGDFVRYIEQLQRNELEHLQGLKVDLPAEGEIPAPAGAQPPAAVRRSRPGLPPGAVPRPLMRVAGVATIWLGCLLAAYGVVMG